jgi:hypothetical protein
VPTLRAAGVLGFHSGRAVRGGRWDAPVDAALVRRWRRRLDNTGHDTLGTPESRRLDNTGHDTSVHPNHDTSVHPEVSTPE